MHSLQTLQANHKRPVIRFQLICMCRRGKPCSASSREGDAKWQQWNSAATCPGMHEGVMQKLLGASGECNHHAMQREHSCPSFRLGSSGTIVLCAPAGFSLGNGGHCRALFPLNYMSAARWMNSSQIPTLLTAVTLSKCCHSMSEVHCSMNNEVLHGLMLVSATV